MAQQQRLSTSGSLIAANAPIDHLAPLKEALRKLRGLVDNSKKDYFVGVKPVVVGADGTKIDVDNRDADWSGAKQIMLEMPCGALLSALNPHRGLPAHVGSRACKGHVCGGGAPRLKRPASASASAAASAASAAEDGVLSDAEPDPKRRKEGTIESFVPTNHQVLKVGKGVEPLKDGSSSIIISSSSS
jgi:hypothetical protein